MSSPLLFVIASLIWGSTFWAITLQLGEVAPAVSIVYRFGLASAPSYWGGLVYLSIFGSVVAFHCYFTLINRIGSQKAVYIGVVTPVISVLLSIQLEGYRPGAIEFLGMIVCLGSVAWAVRAPAPTPKQACDLSTVPEVP